MAVLSCFFYMSTTQVSKSLRAYVTYLGDIGLQLLVMLCRLNYSAFKTNK